MNKERFSLGLAGPLFHPGTSTGGDWQYGIVSGGVYTGFINCGAINVTDFGAVTTIPPGARTPVPMTSVAAYLSWIEDHLTPLLAGKYTNTNKCLSTYVSWPKCVRPVQ